MHSAESDRRKRIKEAFNIDPAQLFEKVDQFDKHIDMIEFMFDDTDDEDLNIAAEIVENELKMKYQTKDLLHDGKDDELNMAMDNYIQNKNVKEGFNKIPKNLLHIVQNSKKEIIHNRLIAKTRLIETKKGKNVSQRFKKEIGDLFYPIESWPNFAIEILLSNTFRYNEWLSLATFFYGNGLRNWLPAERIFKFYNKYWNSSKNWSKIFQKFAALFPYLNQMDTNSSDGPRLRSQYWYFDIESKVTRFFDGKMRTKDGKKITYFEKFNYNY